MAESYIYSNDSSNSKYYERTIADIWELGNNSNIVDGDSAQVLIFTSQFQVSDVGDYYINQDTGDINILRSGIYALTITYKIGTAPTPVHPLFFDSKLNITRLGSEDPEIYLNQKCGYVYAEDDSII